MADAIIRSCRHWPQKHFLKKNYINGKSGRGWSAVGGRGKESGVPYQMEEECFMLFPHWSVMDGTLQDYCLHMVTYIQFFWFGSFCAIAYSTVYSRNNCFWGWPHATSQMAIVILRTWIELFSTRHSFCGFSGTFPSYIYLVYSNM